jgi:hypothetical protein
LGIKSGAEGRKIELFWGGFNQNSSVKNLQKIRLVKFSA